MLAASHIAPLLHMDLHDCCSEARSGHPTSCSPAAEENPFENIPLKRQTALISML